MSYILEAIRKSEQERQEHNHVPDLNAVHTHQAEEGTVQNKNRFWLITLMGIAILVLLALQIKPVLFDEEEPKNTSAQTPPVTATLPQNTVNPEPAPVTQTQLPPVQTVQPALTEALAPKAAEEKQTTEPAPDPIPNSNPMPADVQALYQQQAAQAQVSKLNEPKTLKNLPSAKQIDELNQVLAKNNLAASKPAPVTDTSVYDLPESVLAQIPSLKFGAHIYSETTDSGFTIINGRKHLPGSEISAGLTLLRIQPDQVILSFQGYEFSMPAMRDWIKR